MIYLLMVNGELGRLTGDSGRMGWVSGSKGPIPSHTHTWLPGMHVSRLYNSAQCLMCYVCDGATSVCGSVRVRSELLGGKQEGDGWFPGRSRKKRCSALLMDAAASSCF